MKFKVLRVWLQEHKSSLLLAGLILILGLGLVATAIAIQTFYAGVKRVGGARASLISTVEPVYTVALAVILFGERLTPMQIVGGALVIFAVILAETGRPQTAAGDARMASGDG